MTTHTAMKKFGALVGAIALGTALSGCFVTGSSKEKVSQGPVEQPSAAAPAASDPAMDLMPVIDVVSMGPFEAEAALNDSGLLTVIHVDAAEAGRVPDDDEHWKVCWQDPIAGIRVPVDTVVTLGSTSLDEPCEGEPDTP